MTLAEAGEIFRYWEDNPPSHLLLQAIARLLGWQPHAQPRAAADALAALAAMPPPGLAVMPATQIAMPQAVFDLETLRTRNHARARAGAKQDHTTTSNDGAAEDPRDAFAAGR